MQWGGRKNNSHPKTPRIPVWFRLFSARKFQGTLRPGVFLCFKGGMKPIKNRDDWDDPIVLRHTIIAKHFMIDHESYKTSQKKNQNRLKWVIPIFSESDHNHHNHLLHFVRDTVTTICYRNLGVAPKLPILKGFLVAATP